MGAGRRVGQQWERVTPEAAGFDGKLLAEAIAFAQANETPWPTSMFREDGKYIGCATIGDKPPYDVAIGPVFPRGPSNGMVLRGGKLVASWGDTTRADMTFSVAKSFIAILVGVAVQRGLIKSIDDRVADYALDDGYASEQNAPITWRNLLELTSEWQGTLFDRPDSVDWNRQVGATTDGNADKGAARTIKPAGTYFEYNDVRVNRLALSLLQVFKDELGTVLEREIMAHLPGSDQWRWNGYINSWVNVEGRWLQSVSGGGHWGGGMVINSEDLLRVGQLMLNQGRGPDGQQLVAADWVKAMMTPSANNPNYGLLWWLNTARTLHPAASDTSVFAQGAGGHVIWIDPAQDLVVVARWLNKPAMNAFFGQVTAALKG